MICVIVDAKDDKALIVPVVSRHSYSDISCVLQVGDHPFLKHDSCAAYDHTKVLSWSSINTAIEDGSVVLKGNIGPDLLNKLQIGFVISDETAPWVYDQGSGDLLRQYLEKKGCL